MNLDALKRLQAQSAALRVAAEQSRLSGRVSDLERQEFTAGGALAGDVPTPADSVVTEQAFGQAAAAGAGVEYSRGDHTHGTPDAPDDHTVSEGPGIDLVVSALNSQIGVGMDSILLAHASGAPADEFAATGVGVAAALAAAASGDTVLLPSATLNGGPWTVPAGVTVYGIDRQASVLSGQVTLDAGATIANMTLSRSTSSSGAVVGVVGPSSDMACILLCLILIINTGSGPAYGAQVQDGTLTAWSADIEATSSGGAGYGVEFTGSGTLDAVGGKIIGSTADLHGGGSTTTVTEWHFPSDAQSWVKYASLVAGWLPDDGADPTYGNFAWDGSHGHTANGCLAVDTLPVPPGPLFRFGGARLDLSPGIFVHTGDTLSAWFYKVSETRAGENSQASGPTLAIQYTDATRSYISGGDTVVGSWAQLTLTVGAAQDGKQIDFLVAAGESDSQSTASFYIDDIVLTRSISGSGGANLSAVQLSRAQSVGAVDVWSDRSAWDALDYADRHTNDTDVGLSAIHHTLGISPFQAAAGDHTHGSLPLPERYLAPYNYNFGSGYQIGLARSADINLRTWSGLTEPIVAKGAASAWDDANVKDPFLVADDEGTLWLFYTGSQSGGNFSIGVSRSFDGGTTWTKYASNPVLAGAGGWEGSSVNFAHVIFDRTESNSSKRWKMWYGGNAGTGGTMTAVGYAYSADGLSWTKYASNPVLSLGAGGTWEDTYMAPGPVVRLGGTYYLFYNANDGSGTWRAGLATFTDPEGTYTKSAANPLLSADGKTSALTSSVSVSDVTLHVASSTIFPVGAPVWVYDASHHYLTHVSSRPTTTSIAVADAAPVAISATGGNVRSVAYNSLWIQSAVYDGGWRFGITPFQPGVDSDLKELSLLGWANDLAAIFIDYGAGVLIPVTLAESQGTNVSRENPALFSLYWADTRHWRTVNAGTVASVGLSMPAEFSVSSSPVTGSGTLTVTKANESANTGFLGPTSGGAAAPTFRALVAADLPNTAVTPGSYTLAGFTVDAQGRLTAASSGTASSSGGAGQLQGTTRNSGDGATTAFVLPDTAEAMWLVIDNGTVVDPLLYTLSTDGTTVTFNTAPTSGHWLQFFYAILQV